MIDFSEELKKDFLDEAFDLLDMLEKNLLKLEKNPADQKAVQEVFRAAHTVKGGAGTVGFNEIQQFMHVQEDLLDLVRKDRLRFSSSDISLLLECRDELERLLEARKKGQTHVSPRGAELIARLERVKAAAGGTPAEPRNPPTVAPDSPPESSGKMEQIRLGNADLSLINEALTQSRRVFLLKYSLNASYEMRDVSSFQVYALLNDFTEVIKIAPSLSDLETKFYPEVFFIVSTDRDEAFIRDKTYLKDMITKLILLKVTPDTLRELENILMRSSTREAVIQVNKIEQKPGRSMPAPAPERESPVVPDSGSETASGFADPSPAAQPAVSEDALQKRNITSLRVESWKIDELLNLLGELVITKAGLAQLASEFERNGADVKSSLKDFLSGIQKLNLGREGENSEERNAVLSRALGGLFSGIELFADGMQKLGRISASLQENVMAMRMVPIQMVFSRFPRLIRDMAEKLGKKVDLVIEGVETEIDKGLVDDLFDPLIHILRNAVDHGIEMPAQRRQAGKSETGRVVLKAAHEGDSIVIEVADDGQGVDLEALKRKAVETGVLSQESADSLPERDILGLIFLPGISTSRVVSNLSGRGVGMDVVKKKIEEIGGSVSVGMAAGKGSRIVIRLPLTLAIIQGLLVTVNGMNYILPVASVDETVIVDRKDIREINRRLTMELRGKFIPVLSLMDYFYPGESGGQKTGEAGTGREYCIVSRYGDSLVGILVGDVVGEQDIVIKPLNTKLIRSRGISAATIIGNGDIGFIIDPAQIIASHSAHAAHAGSGN